MLQFLKASLFICPVARIRQLLDNILILPVGDSSRATGTWWSFVLPGSQLSPATGPVPFHRRKGKRLGEKMKREKHLVCFPASFIGDSAQC